MEDIFLLKKYDRENVLLLWIISHFSLGESSDDEEEENKEFSLLRLTNTTVFFSFDHPLSGIRGSEEGEEVSEDSIAVSAWE